MVRPLPPPQMSTPASISTSVIRISPVGSRILNNSQNPENLWTEHNTILKQSGTVATSQEQQGIILQNALTSAHNYSSHTEAPEQNVHHQPQPTNSPLRNHRVLVHNERDEPYEYVASSPNNNKTQTVLYSMDHPQENNCLVIKNSSDMSSNNQSFAKEDKYCHNSLVDQYGAIQLNSHHVIQHCRQPPSPAQPQSRSFSEKLIQPLTPSAVTQAVTYQVN